MKEDSFSDAIKKLRSRDDIIAVALVIPNKEFRGLTLRQHVNFRRKHYYEIYRVYNIAGGCTMYPLSSEMLFTENKDEALEWFDKTLFGMTSIHYL